MTVWGGEVANNWKVEAPLEESSTIYSHCGLMHRFVL